MLKKLCIETQSLKILLSEIKMEIQVIQFQLILAQVNQQKRKCGTPGYVAPEILNNEPYDTQVDVFSAGIIMFILLTGSSLFYGESYIEILTKNKECEIDEKLKDIQSLVSANAFNLMKKMLKKNPKERITSQQALLHPWFKEKSESISTKIHHKTMEKLMKHQQELIKMTKPENMTASQDLIINSPLLSKINSASTSSTQNSGKNSPNKQCVSPTFIISPVVEKKSKFATKK